MKKSKQKVLITPPTKEHLDALKFELRKGLLSRGAKQCSATRFEVSEMTSRGTYVTFRYELCRHVLQKWILNVNWKRKSRKTGNQKPYRWEIYADNWYQNVHILHGKNKIVRILGLIRE